MPWSTYREPDQPEPTKPPSLPVCELCGVQDKDVKACLFRDTDTFRAGYRCRDREACQKRSERSR